MTIKTLIKSIPGALPAYKKISAIGKLEITAVGSCLCLFVNKQLKMRMPVFINSHLWARSDSACDYMEGRTADPNLIGHYLSRGVWNHPKVAIIGGKEVSYARYYADSILGRYIAGAEFLKCRPDVLLMDSYFDQYTTYYQHKNGWRAFFGRIGFENKEIEEEFNQIFTYIGRIDAAETVKNVQKLSTHFLTRSPKIKIFYMHFPLLPGYLPEKVYRQDEMIRKEIAGIAPEIPNFFILDIPISKVVPLTDASHPNYSVEIWNHFYPEVYDFFADRIIAALQGKAER